MKNKVAIIIGAGPAGLTAAFELLERTDIKPMIYEETASIGGICTTVNFKGNRIDLGGHRFFSKSDRVMDWWKTILPIQGSPAKDYKLLGKYVMLSDKNDAPDPEKSDTVMLVRHRLSRIFYLRHFFDYPVALNWNTIASLGFFRILKIGLSYGYFHLFPKKNEKSLEDFLVNRFGKELYLTFFKDYTEKVWGYPCDKISKEWGAQRIKGLSLLKTIQHALHLLLGKKNSLLSQKGTETSLIEQFLYPKYGPGHLWEKVAKIIQEKGGEIHLGQKITRVNSEGTNIRSVTVVDQNSGKEQSIIGDYFFSSMPIKDLISGFRPSVPLEVRQVAEGLVYRDFMTVGLLVKELKIKNNTKIKTINNIVPDNWIYIQDCDVKLGRLQIFNNWSPYMVDDDRYVWIGLEYFCNEGDELWTSQDADFKAFATGELEKIGILSASNVVDSVVIRARKAYPAYFGTYSQFDMVRGFCDSFENMFLIGRNGMHRYNNMDHSMLTAMTAVDNIIQRITAKDNIWAINTEDQYHEGK